MLRRFGFNPDKSENKQLNISPEGNIQKDMEFSTAFMLKYTAVYIYVCSIQHWRIFRSSFRKLASVGFEPTITELRSDALTDWAIRPWVQLALSQLCRATPISSFAQFSSLIMAIVFISRHSYFNRNYLPHECSGMNW